MVSPKCSVDAHPKASTVTAVGLVYKAKCYGVSPHVLVALL